VSWSAVFVALFVSHLVGDFLLQTDSQARRKVNGLDDPEARRALLLHTSTYTLAFVPAIVWIGIEQSPLRALVTAALIGGLHLVVDEGTLVRLWLGRVKHVREPDRVLALTVDQSFHAVCLLAIALVAST
jgi:hypothetical protein